MKKKARFYLGFFICSGERVKTVFTCSRVFLSLICTNARTRINTGFFVHSLISISQAVRGRTGQVTVLVPGGDRSGPTEAAAETAALGRRGLLRAANWKARAQVGWRQVKVLPAFSKAAGFGGHYVPVGRCSAADRAGRRDRRPKVSGLQGVLVPGGHRLGPTEAAAETASPCLPKRQQKWGDGCPPLGVPPRPGFLLEEGAGRVAQSPLPGLSAAQRAPRSLHFFHRLRRVKVKAARRCLALCKPLKRLERNFSLSLPYPSATPYTIRNSGWLYSTTWPLPTQISATVPSTSAGISFISFMASMMHRVSPFFTWSPTSTKGLLSGLAAA